MLDVICCRLYVIRICSELGNGEAGKYLFRAANVWWRCAQYFVISSSG